jgi:hypothetical protein
LPVNNWNVFSGEYALTQEHQSTNLGVRSSNLFGRANKIKHFRDVHVSWEVTKRQPRDKHWLRGTTRQSPPYQHEQEEQQCRDVVIEFNGDLSQKAELNYRH